MSEKWNPSEESLEQYKKRIGAKKQQGQVDVEGIEKLREDLEEQTVENEDLKMKLALVAEQKLKEKKEKLNFPQNLELESVNQEIGALKLLEHQQGKGKSKPSGTVPLASQNAGSDSEGFDSHKEMVEYLKELSKEKGLRGKEARKVLDDLWLRKMPIAVGNRKIIAQFPNDKQLAEGETMKSLLNKKFRKKMRERRGEE